MSRGIPCFSESDSPRDILILSVHACFRAQNPIVPTERSLYTPISYGLMFISPHTPEKYKTSDNNSPPLPTESDDPGTGCGIPPDGAAF